MKKQLKTLTLKKQSISALDAIRTIGGAPTTMTMVTQNPGCPDPATIPSGPQPESMDSLCLTMVKYCG